MTTDDTRGPADERRPLGSDELAAIRETQQRVVQPDALVGETGDDA